MRVVAGDFKGRQLSAPKTTSTRPMTDKVRAALFDSLGKIEGSVVLDAYAGSGAVGIEALSRGAEQVVFIESGRLALKALKQNLAALGINWGYQTVESTVEWWLARQSLSQPAFDLIIADPPYEQLKPDVIEKLGRLLPARGALVLSHSSRQESPVLEDLKLADTKLYGDTALTFYHPAG